MTAPHHTQPPVIEALAKVSDFVAQVTGRAPTGAELADALTRYFVLNEIQEHIVMLREGDSDSKA